MKKIIFNNKGMGYIDICVFILIAMLVLVLIINVFSVFIAKQQLDMMATELARECEMVGRVGTETRDKERELIRKIGLDADVNWSSSGNIQLNSEVTVTLTYEKDIGLFGGIASFPITLKAQAVAKSEVYHK